MTNKDFDTKTYSPDEVKAHYQNKFPNTFTDYLGLELLHYEPGYCYARLKIKPEFINSLGGLHGGLLYTVADTAAGVASLHLGSGTTVTTVNGDMQFLRPALNLDYIYVKANMVKDGKRLVFTDVTIHTKDDTLLAKGSFTFARITIPGVNTPE